MPCDHDIPSATWTRQAVAELMAKRVGVDLTLQGVGQYLRSNYKFSDQLVLAAVLDVQDARDALTPRAAAGLTTGLSRECVLDGDIDLKHLLRFVARGDPAKGR
jgi:hypothetical protein